MEMGPEGKTTFMSVVCVAVVVSVLVLHSCDDYRHDRRLARSCLLSMAVVRGLPDAPLPLCCPTCSTVFQVDTAMNILSPFTSKLGEAIDAHGDRTAQHGNVNGRWHFRRRRFVRSTTTRQFCSCLHNIAHRPDSDDVLHCHGGVDSGIPSSSGAAVRTLDVEGKFLSSTARVAWCVCATIQLHFAGVGQGDCKWTWKSPWAMPVDAFNCSCCSNMAYR